MISGKSPCHNLQHFSGYCEFTHACHFRNFRNFDTNMVTKRQGVVREVYQLKGVWQKQECVKGLRPCPHFAPWCG